MKTENTDRIENYLDGKLPPDEIKKFQEELTTDPLLAEEFEQRKKIASLWNRSRDFANTRKEVADAIVQEKARIRRRIAEFSVAASVLVILTVSSIVILNKKVTNNQMANSRQELVTPGFKQPEEKGSYGEIRKMVLLHPVNDTVCSRKDSLVFHWSPALADTSFILIENINTRNTVFREKLNAGKNSFKLESHFLPVGNYFWQIGNTMERAGFKVTE